MYEENYQVLANAIIVQAAKDFRAAYKRLKRFPNDRLAASEVRSCTKFFCSDYFQALTDLDGPALLRRMMKEIDEKYADKGGDAQ